MNLNQLFKAKLDKEFPPKKYVCQCKNMCQRFNPEAMDCMDCIWCGTNLTSQDRNPEDIAYETSKGSEIISLAGVF